MAEVLARFGRVDAVKVKVSNAARASTTTPPAWPPSGEALPDAAIRVDANGGWGTPEAVTALKRLAAVGLEYAEQPVPDIAGLAEVRRAASGRRRSRADRRG